VSAAIVPVIAPGDTTMRELHEQAHRMGLVLVTDGHELAYSIPHHIPLGWRRFVIVDKPRPLDPKEPQA
jgi:hypothetical protein